ncbi:hypothetical protein [Actinomycetospora chiangmaiensis]|uniref:hypothetical protein n=1 Tax=Actinomycetospora chiangmaiensis TaxID=402650 RepID=UPI000380D952|nr:hypothetical protein [Actinomycetospora chiangmaiensis]
MLEPVGPLPPSVYWRRRAVAAIVVVLVLAFVVWAVSAAASADGTEQVAAPAPTPSAPPSPVASSGALAVPPGGAGSLGAFGAPTAAVFPGGATPPLLGAGSTDPQQLSVTPTPTTAAPAPPPAPAVVPPCQDAALKVAARTDRPRYTLAERPLFSLVVTNTGKTPCTRDLGPARTAMAVVIKPGDGLWGSDDCAPGGAPDVRTLVPGQEQVLSLRWAGRTSAPGCPSGREAVPAGTYQLLTRLDGTISDPATFTLVP